MVDQLTTKTPETLETHIRLGIANLSGILSHRIQSQPNREKYSRSWDDTDDDQNLSEVFDLMRSLNEKAVTDERIGCNTHGGWNFRESLARFATDLAETMNGVPFTYVELGPEPVKTSFLINRLRANGAQIRHYIGVDINPASTMPMHDALSEFLDPAGIAFRLKDFADLRASDIHVGNMPSVITMLGFQEGNEHPATITQRLARVATSGDLIASEMQVAESWTASQIRMFYAAPEMRRFSRLAFERMIGNVPSTYRVYTPTISVGMERPALACVTAEAFTDPADGGESLALTNWCLKPSVQQMRVARKKDDRLEVRSERLTGDGSVLFQLAKVPHEPALARVQTTRLTA